MSDCTAGPGFDALGLALPVLEQLTALGYSEPSPIQAQIIPYLMDGDDVIGQAQTGTGKTAAFSLPLISRLAGRPTGKVQVLVLTPTRELALQVTAAMTRYSAGYPNLSLVSLCGGMDYRPQLRALRGGVQFVIGTPGRVIDHLEKGTLDLSGLQCIVLDEADEMLRMGFIDDVEQVMTAMPESCQVALFSATMPAPIRRLAHRFLKSPQEVTIKAKTETAAAISQQYLYVPQRDKSEALQRVLEVSEFDAAIVFTRTKDATTEVADQLQRAGYRAAALNGDLDQGQREQVVNQLKAGRIDILVGTDVVARGLDVPRISLVVNYDIPFDAETYVHRIGRTGRAGRSGNAVLFVTPKDKRLLYTIERTTRQPVAEMEWPTAATINAIREKRFMARIDDKREQAKDSPFVELVQRYLQENADCDPAELAGALALMAQGEAPFYVTDKPRPKKPATPRGETPPRPRRAAAPRKGGDARRGNEQPDSGMARYRVAVGHRHGVKPGNLVGAIANEIGLPSKHIGRINIDTGHSTVDLPSSLSAGKIKHLKTVWVSGRQLDIQPA